MLDLEAAQAGRERGARRALADLLPACRAPVLLEQRGASDDEHGRADPDSVEEPLGVGDLHADAETRFHLGEILDALSDTEFVADGVQPLLVEIAEDGDLETIGMRQIAFDKLS